MNEQDIEAIAAQAVEYHGMKYSCAQSVACATCHLAGLDADEAYRLMEGFGAGMGGFDQVCGAVSGGVLVLGYANSDGREARTTKPETHRIAHEFVQEFAAAHDGCTQCADLRPADPASRRATCDGYIAEAARLVASRL